MISFFLFSKAVRSLSYIKQALTTPPTSSQTTENFWPGMEPSPTPYPHPAQMFPFSSTGPGSTELWPGLWRQEISTFSSKVGVYMVYIPQNTAKAVTALNQNQGQMACNLGLSDPHQVSHLFLHTPCSPGVLSFNPQALPLCVCQPLGHTILAGWWRQAQAICHLTKFLDLMGTPSLVLFLVSSVLVEKDPGVLDFRPTSDPWHLSPLGK